MKTVCLYFEIHQPNHLKRYRFFDIGTDHYYYDDYENERATQETAQKSFIPCLQTMLAMAKDYKQAFKVTFSISGVALELLEQYAPEVLVLLQQLNETGCVEFLAEPYSHGLSSLGNEESFVDEVKRQTKKITQIFKQTPKIMRNSSLIYNDSIGSVIADMGFEGVMVEGAKHILGWKSPHYVYSCASDPRLSLLLRDFKLSDDICLRFNDSSWSEYPLMADKYLDWIASVPADEKVINIGMDLCALGIYQPLNSHILDFLYALPAEASKRNIRFATASEVLAENKAVSSLEMIHPVSWNDEERDTSSLLGNCMQRDAFERLYDEKIVGRILACRDRRIKQDWDRLQASDNFRFMTTKSNQMNSYRGIYESPYDAFTNYMNILGDFLKRVRDLFSDVVENDELNSLYTQITNLDKQLESKEMEITLLKARLSKYEPKEETAETSPQTAEASAALAESPAAEKTEATPKKKAPKRVIKKETTPKTSATKSKVVKKKKSED